MSGTSQRLGGLAFLTINGDSYDVVADAIYDVATVKRETLSGQSRVEGYSEMPKSGRIGATVRDNAAFSVAAINAIEDATVVLSLANGKVISGNGMWNTECSEVKTQEGTFAVMFEGGDVSES